MVVSFTSSLVSERMKYVSCVCLWLNGSAQLGFLMTNQPHRALPCARPVRVETPALYSLVSSFTQQILTEGCRVLLEVPVQRVALVGVAW